MVTERENVSSLVNLGQWDDAQETMLDAQKCFIGEKYMYSDFPDMERWNLETLASDIIGHHDIDAWKALTELRDRLGELLDVNLR